MLKLRFSAFARLAYISTTYRNTLTSVWLAMIPSNKMYRMVVHWQIVGSMPVTNSSILGVSAPNLLCASKKKYAETVTDRGSRNTTICCRSSATGQRTCDEEKGRGGARRRRKISVSVKRPLPGGRCACDKNQTRTIAMRTCGMLCSCIWLKAMTAQGCTSTITLSDSGYHLMVNEVSKSLSVTN